MIRYNLGIRQSLITRSSKISPISVVFSWLNSSQLSDKLFCISPKINLLKERIHPSINDTVVCIEVTGMMFVMFLMTYNEA